MDESSLFRLILILIYGMFGAVRIYYRTRKLAPSKENTEKKEGIDKIGGWVGIILTVGILGMFTSMIIYLISPPWFLWSQLPVPFIIRIIGVVGGLISIPFLIWIHRTLGKFYSPILEVKEEHRLIDFGPYSYIRHPMYSVFIFFTLSIALLTANLLICCFSLLVVIPFPFIARQEEKMLHKELGTTYQEYMQKTGRFLPKYRK